MLKARFERKENAIDVQPFRIVSLEKIGDDQWQHLSISLLEDYDIIKKHADNLYVGSDGITNALLVLNEKTGEGILINSEGSAYARYSAYLPFAKPYLDYELALIADYCVTEGMKNTSDGLWTISFDEIKEHFDIDVSNDDGMKEMMINCLHTRDDVVRVIMTEYGFKIKYTLDYCPPIPVLNDSYEEFYQEDVDIALAKHMLWIYDAPGGEQADFSGKRFRNIDFSSYKLNSAIFKNSLLENCKFNSTELCLADFTGAILKNCSMIYIAVDDLIMKNTFIENCDISYLIGCHCNFADAKFVNCQLFNGKTVKCCFENTVFCQTNTEDSYIDPEDGITERQWLEDNYMTNEQEMQ